MFPYGLFCRPPLLRINEKGPGFRGLDSMGSALQDWIVQSNCLLSLLLMIGLHNPIRKSAQDIAFDIAEDASQVDVFNRHSLWLVILPGGTKPPAEFAGLSLELRVSASMVHRICPAMPFGIPTTVSAIVLLAEIVVRA